MWLKRKKAASSVVPQLRDEYERMLHEALPDVKPLQEVTKPLRTCGPLDATKHTQWQDHQRALRPFVEAGKAPGARPVRKMTGKQQMETACAQ